MAQALAPSAARRRFDVAVRGDGVVGQTLALLLARDRLRVALVAAPKPANSPPDVRAYAINAASRELLRSVRAWPEGQPADPAHPLPTAGVPTVTPITAMNVRGDGGGSVQFSAAELGSSALSWIVDVPALEQRLAHAVHFQGGIECMEVAPPAALTVICEGRRSASRDEIGLSYAVRPYPHKAIAARLRCSQPHGGVARQWFVQGEVLALLPLEGAGGNAVALVWSVPSQEADDWLAGDPQALAQAIGVRTGNILGDLQLEHTAQAWPLELSHATRWVTQTAQGSVALAGDAAHAIHPLAGQGLNVGLGDVAELARVIHEREYWRALGDMKLLRRYERARQADTRTMAWLTDSLFGLFAEPDTRVQALRNWGLRRVDQLGPIKHWLARQAMGQTG
jgi:2-polyprenyl-6-methoxyphenol hydroxylase-like FAD-dependent oxidoreductase